MRPGVEFIRMLTWLLLSFLFDGEMEDVFSQFVWFLSRINGHDGAAELLVETVGPQMVNIRDAKGRCVSVVTFCICLCVYGALSSLMYCSLPLAYLSRSCLSGGGCPGLCLKDPVACSCLFGECWRAAAGPGPGGRGQCRGHHRTLRPDGCRRQRTDRSRR